MSEPCPFCLIASTHVSWPPLSPPASIEPDLTAPASFPVLSTSTVIAFLDIMPLSPGHMLLCPRRHAPKVTDATSAESRALGFWIRVLSAAISRATGVNDWNVVQNNGAAAAQVVPHMHYHVIPRPEIRASGRFRESFTMFGRGVREELDDDKAVALAGKVREKIAEILKEEGLDGQEVLEKTRL